MAPLKISDRTLRMLEWPQFLELFSTYVTAPAAREQIEKVRPVDSLPEELALSREALQCASKGQIPSLHGLENVTFLLQKAAVENQVLDGIEIYRIGKLAMLIYRIRSVNKEWRLEFPQLSEKCAKLPDVRLLQQEIELKMDPSGAVKDDATPELKQILKQIAHLKTRVERLLERYLGDARYSSVLQEDYVTYRHGRGVLLIRTEHKSAIRGVIHGESGSGASVFLEPLNVLELNNDLAQLADRQLQETTRILRTLTAQIGRDSTILQFAVQQLISLDLIFARGRFGAAFHCALPEFTNDFRIQLQSGRHPLLEATLMKQNQRVVPLSFELHADKKALVVTGPNTGGKTVLLKTAGLLSLMVHAALPIPAAEGSVFPRFSQIEADIGDQQSISSSLSTFSSHITNIVSILSQLEDSSLILLDELGTGTDPEEGGPLAVAILQELLRHNVKAMITSHHSQMKMFAFRRAECVTAAMEFDESNLLPTYRMLPDQIGASHALEMAQRLGLPSSILEQARTLTGQNQRELQEFQKQLQNRIAFLELQQAEWEKEKAKWEDEASEKQRTLEASQKKLQQQLERLREQNSDLIRTINANVENLLTAIQDAQQKQQLRKQYREQVASKLEELQQLTGRAEPPPDQITFQPGERVWVSLYKDFGEILLIRKDQAELLIRSKRFTVPLGMLERRESGPQFLPKGVKLEIAEKHAEPELNLIGQTVEEAVAATDKYLDDAVLSGLHEVRLIHGHGSGRLRKAIHEMLETHPHVQSFHSESPERGGTGVTVAVLKPL